MTHKKEIEVNAKREIHKTSKNSIEKKEFPSKYWVITARKVFTFLSKNVWFLEMSDEDDDGVDAFLSTFTLSPMRHT